MRPVKGEILRLRAPGTPHPPVHTIRAALPGSHVYLVPRDDGVVVGQLNSMPVRDRSNGGQHFPVTADAIAVMPELSGYAPAEASAGLRPIRRTAADHRPPDAQHVLLPTP